MKGAFFLPCTCLQVFFLIGANKLRNETNVQRCDLTVFFAGAFFFGAAFFGFGWMSSSSESSVIFRFGAGAAKEGNFSLLSSKTSQKQPEGFHVHKFRSDWQHTFVQKSHRTNITVASAPSHSDTAPMCKQAFDLCRTSHRTANHLSFQHTTPSSHPLLSTKERGRPITKALNSRLIANTTL